MSREPQMLELDGDITISSAPLPWEKAEDLLPEIGQLLGLTVMHAKDLIDSLVGAASLKQLDVVAIASGLGPLVSALSDKLGNGGLKRLAPLLLLTTTVVMPDAQGIKASHDLVKKDERANVFGEHPEIYFIALFFAAKVTFAGFFPAIGSLLAKLKAMIPTPTPTP